MLPTTTTNDRLREFVSTRVLPRYACRGMRAADLGAKAARLRMFQCDVLAVDRDLNRSESGVPHLLVDFNKSDFPSAIRKRQFSLVTAIEVIEHFKNPIVFLRKMGALLTPGGIATLNNPNVDSLLAQVQLLLAGKIRSIAEYPEPMHIFLVLFDLLQHQYPNLACGKFRKQLLFSPNGHQLTRRLLGLLFRIASVAFPGESLLSENFVMAIEAQA
jgi:SAM-dependent methyltransferase